MRDCRSILVSAGLACLCLSEPGAQQLLDSVLVDKVPAAFPVGFDLLTRGNRLYLAYYDSGHNMVAASRRLDAAGFDRKVLPSRIGWDSHNGVVLALDDQGQLHVSGNMHGVPLVYFRTDLPGEVASLVKIPNMVSAARETRVTYPHFLTAGAQLYFFYRQGGSGDGVWYFNQYDSRPSVRSWSALHGGASVFGNAGSVNAYFNGPILGPDNRYHFVFMWRDSPDAASNHDISYMRTRGPDLSAFETVAGTALDLPVTLQHVSAVVDPVAPARGLINMSQSLGFDTRGSAIVSYHKYDAGGISQAYNARWSAAERKWQVAQASDWKGYTWAFSGGGSIPADISVGGVKVQGGKLVQSWRHAKFGSGEWTLDEATLKPIPVAKKTAALPVAAALSEKFLWSRGEGEDPTVRYALRWETQPANRDVKPDVIPPDSRLMLLKYRVATSGVRSQAPRAAAAEAAARRDGGLIRFRKPGAPATPGFDGRGRVLGIAH